MPTSTVPTAPAAAADSRSAASPRQQESFWVGIGSAVASIFLSAGGGRHRGAPPVADAHEYGLFCGFTKKEAGRLIRIRKGLLHALDLSADDNGGGNNGDGDDDDGFLMALCRCAASAATEDLLDADAACAPESSGITSLSRAKRRAALFESAVESTARDVLPTFFDAALRRGLMGGGGTENSSTTTGAGSSIGIENDANTRDEAAADRHFLKSVARLTGRSSASPSAAFHSDQSQSSSQNRASHGTRYRAEDALFDLCLGVGNARLDGNEDDDEIDNIEVQSTANANDLIMLCHRLAVVCHWLDLAMSEDARSATTDPDNHKLPLPLPRARVGRLDAPTALVRALLQHRNAMRGGASDADTREDADADADNASVSRRVFREWCCLSFPSMCDHLAAFTERLLLPNLCTDQDGLGGIKGEKSIADHDCSTRRRNLRRPLPRINYNLKRARSGKTGSSPFFDAETSTLMFALVSASRDTLGGTWHRLYSTDEDGLSFAGLERSISGYAGPTILLAYAADDDNDGLISKFGAAVSCPWERTGAGRAATDAKFGMGDGAYLFSLEPNARIMRPLTQDQPGSNGGLRIMFHPNRGLGIGGTERQPRFFVAPSLDRCRGGARDSFFEAGPLVAASGSNRGIGTSVDLLDLYHLEVWGVCGGDGAVIRDASVAMASKRANDKDRLGSTVGSVGKDMLHNDFASGLFDSKMFVHRDQFDNRGGCFFECEDADY